MKIEDCVAIVTGGNRGIGLGFVEELLDHGARRVYIGSRNKEDGEQIAARDPDRAEQTSRIHIRNALAARLDGFDGLGEMGLSGPARDGAEGPA